MASGRRLVPRRLPAGRMSYYADIARPTLFYRAVLHAAVGGLEPRRGVSLRARLPKRVVGQRPEDIRPATSSAGAGRPNGMVASVGVAPEQIPGQLASDMGKPDFVSCTGQISATLGRAGQPRLGRGRLTEKRLQALAS